jgi:hypothetical protein
MEPFTLKLVTAILTAMLTAANLTCAQNVVQASGTLSEFGPDTIVVRSTTSGTLVRYISSQTTTYVDETGAPLISIDLLKVGVPVTVDYIKIADQMVASRVLIRKSTTSVPVEEKKSTTITTTRE